MNFKIIGFAFGILLLLVVVGGVGYKIVAPTTKTVIGQGGKLTQLFTEPPSIPILRGGCGIHKLNLETSIKWAKGFNLQEAAKAPAKSK